MKRKKSLIISISAIVLLLSSFFIWKFYSQPSTVNPQTSQSSTASTNLTAEEKIYKELIGNLSSVINDSEKTQVQTLIKKLVDIENNNNDDTEKATIYKDIIKILDEVTLRGHSQEDLDKYQKISEKFQNAKSDPLPEMYQYKITSTGGIEADMFGLNGFESPEHTKAWKTAKKIIPFELLKDVKYFVPFKVDTSKNSYAAGFMQPLDFEAHPYDWALGVATNADSTYLPYTLIHEYGHYVSLKDTTLKLNDSYTDIKAEGGELLQSFAKECLGHIAEEMDNIEKDNHYLFYARHKDDFVSMYATTNLLEDFAESFARFVMNSTYDSEILTKKMNFLNNHPDLVAIKNQILNNLKNNNMGEISIATV